MPAYMTIEEARKIERKPIKVGLTYYFYSDCVECKTERDDEFIRAYSGQRVLIFEQTHEATDEESISLYRVRAHNGDTFIANEGELNGWIFDTGQWVGPRVN